MKKHLLTTALCMAATGSLSAQTHCLTGIDTNSGTVFYEHFYNSSLRLDSTSYFVPQTDGTIGYFANKYSYDENGHIVLNKIYMKPKGSDTYVYSQYIEYKYDSNGNMAERSNYEKFGSGSGNFILGGTYVYIYDSNGRLTERNLYTDTEKKEQFDTTSYEYDSQGRLSREESYLLYMGMDLFSSGTMYKYNDNGTIAEKISFVITPEGQETSIGGTKYIYDADGNITECQVWDNDEKNIKQKEVFTYETELAKADVVLPLNGEEDYTIPLNSNNAVSRDELYTIYGGQMTLYDTYNYYYTAVKDLGVKPAASVAEPLNVFSPDGGNSLVAANLTKPTGASIYDTNGRLVLKADLMPGQTMDISRLDRGVYIVVTQQGNARFCK